MIRLAIMICLFLYSLYLSLAHMLFSSKVMLLFLAAASMSLVIFSLHDSRRILKGASVIGIALLTVISPQFVILLPPLLFVTLTCFPPAAVLLLLSFIHFATTNAYEISAAAAVGCVMSVLLYFLSIRYELYKKSYLQSRDTLLYETLQLSDRNKTLAKKADDAVTVAILSERNRIAREIHDNVGHMLTRAILQTGAIQVINSQENLKEPLGLVKSTLDEAMNSIRKSVHGLYDESVNLKFAAEDIIGALPQRFRVNVTYEIGENIEREKKLCIIAVLKESVSNIIRHSNGDRVEIILSEHPGFYKLSVTDNGHTVGTVQKGGIGLINMKSRVRDLGGVMEITRNPDSFRLYMTIPKGESYVIN